MSLRFYIGSITKLNHNKIEQLSLTEMMARFKPDEYESLIFPLLDKKILKNVFELGSEYNDDFLKKHTKPFFKNKTVIQSFKNHDVSIRVLSQKGLEAIIDKLHKDIKDSFYKILSNFQSLKEGKIEPYELMKLEASIKGLHSEWNDKFTSMNYSPYNLNKDRPLVNSWKYEYAIFELVLLYRNFDFDKNELVFYSY